MVEHRIKVLLVARNIDKQYFKGFTRYTLGLFGELNKLCNVTMVNVSINESKIGYSKELQALIPVQTIFKLAHKEYRHYDIIHSLDPFLGAFLPFLFQNTVVTFHDLVPLTLRGKWKHESFIQAYHHMIYKSASLNKRIIAGSTQTKNELIKILRTPADKIDIISSGGVEKKFIPLAIRSKSVPTLGYFGNFCQRKRVDLAIETYRKIKSNGFNCQLILAGGNIDEPSKKRFDVGELTKGLQDVTTLDFVPEDQIVDLYNKFDILLCTSDTEGFGLHIPEAQRCGIPVLVRRQAAIPEEVKYATIQCDSTDEMANQAKRLLTDHHYYQEVRERGMSYSSIFNWENIAKDTMVVYEKILAKR